MIRQFELVERVQSYDPHADEDMLNRAYVYGLRKHGTQLRASGDPYFSHPVEIFKIWEGGMAFHGGLMDLFTSTLPYKTPPTTPFSCNDVKIGPNSVMGYYDGNTVTALWNYAQYFAMISSRVPSFPSLNGLPQIDALKPLLGTARPM